MKKTTIIVIAAVVTAAILSGCSKNAQTQGASDAAVQVSAGNPSWSQNKTPYTVTWFLAYDWYGKTFNPALNLGDKKFLEETGMTLEFSVGNTEKLNMLIATDGLPDLVTFDAVASQRKLLESGGVLLDLDELAAKYAPDMDFPQSMKDWYRAEDGKWYAAVNYYYGPERTNPSFGGYYVTHNLNYVRTDILDKIGLTMDDMRTKNGFLNALRKVRDQKITYNGKQVLPYIGGYADSLASQFGADIEDANGNFVNVRRTPEFMEALLFMNTCYNEGLISDEQFTLNTTQRDQKVAAGEIFAYSSWTAVENPRKSLYSADPNARIMYSGVMKGDSGKTPILEAVNCGGWAATMITKNAKNPAKAIQLMAYFSTETATVNGYWGYDGYDLINGKAIQKPSVKAEYAANYEVANAKYNMDCGWFIDWTIVQKYRTIDPEAHYYDTDHINQEMDPSITMYDNKAFAFVNPDDGTDLAVARVKIDDYWDQQYPKMVMAPTAAECTRIFRETLAQMETMGLKDLEAYRNAEFKKNKQKLGVTRIWPR